MGARRGAPLPEPAQAREADALRGRELVGERFKLGRFLEVHGAAAGSRGARLLLSAGRVTVEGEVERSYACKITADFDVRVDGG
eukprot:CAMPEP_0182854132 /NCGR_PEP_ID=MMETSP0034_2-20130328/1075_1 /TAXON_ID=156128 /ORGANISM="Nephroselmis pyriformis, Strain CCMP717" /LENGTH=83 /DNA_ID=CAMNT_0024984931 /DNA_START=82 /DNA_END=329 /DNA_ORIENTATION=-